MADAIIFDKDGTLFDFRATWSVWARTMLDTIAGDDVVRRDAVAHAMGFDERTGFHRTSVVIAGTSRDVGAALIGATGLSAGEIEALANRIAEQTPQRRVPRLSETLAELAVDYILGVVTNDGEAPARAHLSAVDILDHFAFVAGYDSGHGAKPDPGPLLAFCRATETRPERVVMVGDSRHDLSAGRAAGMKTVAVLTGIATARDLDDLADVVLPDISHLPKWIGSQSAV